MGALLPLQGQQGALSVEDGGPPLGIVHALTYLQEADTKALGSSCPPAESRLSC